MYGDVKPEHNRLFNIVVIVMFVGLTLMVSCMDKHGHSGHSEQKNGVDKYTIKGHSCECTIITYGGSNTKLLCTDTTGHMFETTVRNHMVIPINEIN